MCASCVNKDAAEQIKYDPMDKLVEGGEAEELSKDIENWIGLFDLNKVDINQFQKWIGIFFILNLYNCQFN